MNPITIPDNYNYLAFFINLNCNLACHYCINLNEEGSSRKSVHRKPMNGKEWAEAINRLQIERDDMPITLQGGEPTLHKDFFEIINGVRPDIKLDLLTNFMFDVDAFIQNIPPERFTRDAKYAAIRVSYHPGQNDIDDLILKAKKMADAGFYVGIYSVMVPSNQIHIMGIQERCHNEGIDFRVKEYLGFDGQNWHGTYRYPEAISQKVEKYCDCKTSELIVGPTGDVYRCHSDLYESRAPIGYILDPEFKIEEVHRPCYVFGHCNPCDIKIKTNRHQEFGHTSVDIQNIRELTPIERAELDKGNSGLGVPCCEEESKAS